jgi:hypothetical protein
MAALLDISVLLPLAYGAHVHHSTAVAWLDTVQQDGELAFLIQSPFAPSSAVFVLQR